MQLEIYYRYMCIITCNQWESELSFWRRFDEARLEEIERESDRSQSLASERRERLEYLADLLSELQVLAEREGCEKLADLISLSRAEALEESLSDRP
jgi:hypothetical protein